MVRPDTFFVWSGNLSTSSADRTVSHARRDSHGCVVLHGTRSHRTEVRHCSGAFTRYVSGLCSTARSRIYALLHLAAFQTHSEQRYSGARAVAGRSDGAGIASTGVLE